MRISDWSSDVCSSDLGFEFDERAVIGDVRDRARELRADGIFGGDAFPRIAFEMLHAEADALRVAVDADDLHLDRVTDVDRSDVRSVGKECGSTCRARWLQYQKKKTENTMKLHKRS